MKTIGKKTTEMCWGFQVSAEKDVRVKKLQSPKGRVLKEVLVRDLGLRLRQKVRESEGKGRKR